jgi:hypothetical protein
MVNNNERLKKYVFIFQPICQILIYCFLYPLIWKILLKFDFMGKNQLWDLTTMYLLECFILISLILGVLLFFYKKNRNYIISFLMIFYILMTYNDFRSSPKIILIVWFLVALSMLISHLYFSRRCDQE